MKALRDLKAKVTEKVRKVQTKVASKFRRGDHEKGLLGSGAGAVMMALGLTGFLGNQINNMVNSVTNSSSGSNVGAFANDIVSFIGVLSLIIGLIEYRRVRQIRKLASQK